MTDPYSEISEIVNNQNNWRKQCINLIASENATSPAVDKLLVSDFAHRYAEGLPGHRYYQGTKYVDDIEIYTSKLMAKLFNAKFAEVRILSGTQANMAAYASICKPGDTVASASIPCGAHVSHTRWGAAGFMNLKWRSLPFSVDSFNIDIEKASEQLKEEKPKLLILGASLFPFPHPVKELAPVVHDYGGKVLYDGAHVLGLIAAGFFQQPLKEGADLMTASTHKTFFGPQGGLIVTNDDDLFKKVQNNVFPSLVCNHHIHRLPALAMAAAEIEKFGKQYAQDVISNAQSLAKAMADAGFDVVKTSRGFTESHQVVVHVEKLGGGKNVAELCEEANIILNKNFLPTDKISPAVMDNPGGIRIGTQEMTRYGMGKKEMKQIAQLLKRLVIDKEPADKVKTEIIALRANFQKVGYC